ncbi:uncharacterized protein PAC_12214 [Phialocephala subalpina]|uniref:RRM domain-containing protein n=1 Tax=Phialocephala subalpina TaxID=576137 RepID=A0A1L7XBH6_9HELO|nr:uncharacterized protein PAC_12214 [Phialocephala subalpina]
MAPSERSARERNASQHPLDLQQAYSQIYQSLRDMEPEPVGNRQSSNNTFWNIQTMQPVSSRQAGPDEERPLPPADQSLNDKVLRFLCVLQLEADKNGFGRALSILELLKALINQPNFDPSNYPFRNLAAAARQASDQYRELPALHFLNRSNWIDIKDSVAVAAGRRSSSLSATAPSFTPSQVKGIAMQREFSRHELLAARYQVVSTHHPQAVQPQFAIANSVPRATAIVPVRKFKPSRQRMGQERSISPESRRRAQALGMTINPKYKGDMNAFQLRNANTPSWLSSAVRIEGLPEDVEACEIFAAVCEGPVFSLSISGKELPKYPTAAANLTFMTARAARAFIARGNYGMGLWIRGHHLRIWENRNRVLEFDDETLGTSRVLQIIGPARVLSAAEVMHLFHRDITFKEVGVQEWTMGGGMVAVIVEFESILGQSRQARWCFDCNYRTLNERNQCELSYLPDPCDRIP